MEDLESVKVLMLKGEQGNPGYDDTAILARIAALEDRVTALEQEA